MKKLLIWGLTLLAGCSHSYAYYDAEEFEAHKVIAQYFRSAEVVSNRTDWPKSWSDFKEQLDLDTKEVIGKDYKFFYAYDFVDTSFADSSRIGFASSVIAWKFFTLDPAVSYTPSDAARHAEFEVQLRLRPGRIPVGDGFTLGDLADRSTAKGWFKNINWGFYLSQNLSSGKFGFGINAWFGK